MPTGRGRRHPVQTEKRLSNSGITEFTVFFVTLFLLFYSLDCSEPACLFPVLVDQILGIFLLQEEQYLEWQDNNQQAKSNDSRGSNFQCQQNEHDHHKRGRCVKVVRKEMGLWSREHVSNSPRTHRVESIE